MKAVKVPAFTINFPENYLEIPDYPESRIEWPADEEAIDNLVRWWLVREFYGLITETDAGPYPYELVDAIPEAALGRSFVGSWTVLPPKD